MELTPQQQKEVTKRIEHHCAILGARFHADPGEAYGEVFLKVMENLTHLIFWEKFSAFVDKSVRLEARRVFIREKQSRLRQGKES